MHVLIPCLTTTLCFRVNLSNQLYTIIQPPGVSMPANPPKNWAQIRMINTARAAKKRRVEQDEEDMLAEAARQVERQEMDAQGDTGDAPSAGDEGMRVASTGGAGGGSTGMGIQSFGNPWKNYIRNGVRQWSIDRVRTLTVPIWATGGGLLLPIWMLEWWTLGENNMLTRVGEQLYNAPFKMIEKSLRIINFTAISNELRALGGTSITTQTLTNVPFDIAIWNMEHDSARTLKIEPGGNSVQSAQINGFTSALKHGFFVDGIGFPKVAERFGNNVTPGDRWINMIDGADQHYMAKPGDMWAAKINYQQNGPYGWLHARRPSIYNLSTPRPTPTGEKYNFLGNPQQKFDNDPTNLQIMGAKDGSGELFINDPNTSQQVYNKSLNTMGEFGIPEPCTSCPVIVISMHQLQREQAAGTEASAMQVLGHLTMETKFRYLECPPQWGNQATRQINGPDFDNNPMNYLLDSGQRVARTLGSFTVNLATPISYDQLQDIRPILGGPTLQTNGRVPDFNINVQHVA